jgi:hypothetical protein
MSRRKGEITARINERDFPHIVELALPSADFSILPRATIRDMNHVDASHHLE